MMPETSTTTETGLPSSTPLAGVDFSQEATSPPWEWAVVALAVVLALVYLWRQYFSRRKPSCASCGNGKERSCCAVSPETMEEINRRP